MLETPRPGSQRYRRLSECDACPYVNPAYACGSLKENAALGQSDGHGTKFGRYGLLVLARRTSLHARRDRSRRRRLPAKGKARIDLSWNLLRDRFSLPRGETVAVTTRTLFEVSHEKKGLSHPASKLAANSEGGDDQARRMDVYALAKSFLFCSADGSSTSWLRGPLQFGPYPLIK